MPPANPKLAVAYLRVSTTRQEISPEAQRDAIGQWAKREGVRVVAWHLDKGVSGATPVAKREGLTAALHDLRMHQAGRLVVAVRDRLARSVLISLELEARVRALGARIVCANGIAGFTPHEVCFLQIQDAFAELERAQIGERLRAVNERKIAKGLSTGLPPFGWQVRGKRLVPCEAEQHVIWCIASLRRRGWGYESIRAELRDRAILGRRAQPLTIRAIRNIVERLRFVATHRFGDPPPASHLGQLRRRQVWEGYRRALREAERIHPAQAPTQWRPRITGPQPELARRGA